MKGTLSLVVLSVLLHGLNAQVTVTPFNAPVNNLGVGAYDSDMNVAYFLSSSSPTNVYTVAITGSGPVSTVLSGTISIGQVTAARYFPLGHLLYVGGGGGVASYDTLTMQQVATLPLPTNNPVAALETRFSEGETTDGLIFVADLPPANQPTTLFLVDRRTLSLIDSLTLPLADGNITVITADLARDNLLLGTNAGPYGRIVIVNFQGRRFTRTGDYELPVGYTGITAGYIDATRDAAYFSLANPASQIIRLDLASMTRSQVYVAPGTPTFGNVISAPSFGYSFWFSTGANPAVVYRFEQCGYTLVDVTTLASQPSGFALGTNLYLSTGTAALLQLSVVGGLTCPSSTIFRRATSRLESCLVDVRAGVTDPVKNLGYFVTNAPTANVVVVDLSSATLNVTQIFKLSGGYARSVAIDVQNGKLYVGLNDPAAGQVVKLDISTDPRVMGSKAVVHGARSMAFDSANNILYVCTNPRGVGRGYGVIHQIDATTLDIIQTVDLLPEDDGCNVLLFDSMRGALYVGTASYPLRIVKITTQPFARQSFIQLNSQFNQTETGFIDSAMNFAYFGTWFPYGAIIKVNIDTFTLVDIFSGVGLPAFTTSIEDPVHGVSYWVTSQVPASVIRIRSCDFSYVDSFQLRRQEMVPYAATLSSLGGLVLATGLQLPTIEATSGVCGSFVQLHAGSCVPCPAIPSVLTRVATSMQPASVATDTRGAVVDSHTGTAYFITYTTPAVVLKVQLGTLGLAARLVLPNNLGRCAAIDGVRRKAYFGMATNPGAIVKVDLATFTIENTVTTSYAVRTLAYDEYAGVLYAGTSAPAGYNSVVYKVNGLTLEVIATVQLELADGQARTMQLDIPGGYLYVGTSTSPARIVQLKVSRFDRINFIEFPFGYNVMETSLPSSNGALFSISQPYARIVTLNFQNFKWQETMNFPGVTAFASSVSDPINGYSYWFTDEVPSTAYRVKMCNFEMGDTFPLRAADGVPRAAVYYSGKITIGSSCALANLDNTCGLGQQLSFYQLQGGGVAVCEFAVTAPPSTLTVINSTLVSLRFNFSGMIPPVTYCNSTNY